MGLFLTEGGVAGHMNHLYDNPNLTFKEMKNIFQAASAGELEGTEKTDGQNLQLSYDISTSTARAARNKGNIKGGGLDAAGLAEMFAGRGEIKEGYEEIAEALETFEEAGENVLPSFLELKKVFLKLASKDESLSGLTEIFESFETEVRAPTVDSRDFKDNRKAFSKSIRKVITHPSALEIAFNEAFAAFEETVGKLSIEEREEIFGPNTNIYYNAEVQDPRAANLINYDLPTLTIHRVGHNEYDEAGQATGRDVSKNARRLAAALDRVQGEREEGRFYVQMNAIKRLEALDDDTAANLASARLDSVLSDAGISANQTIAEYMISRVDTMIDGTITLPEETKIALIKYIFKDRDEGGKLLADKRFVLKLIPKEDTGTNDAVRKIMDDGEKIKFRSIVPVEEIVHDFSVEMLRGLHSAFILNNEAEVERLRQETARAITAIEASDSEEAMEILQKQMSKLKDIEGVSTAAEGFVFDYDGVTYKFTGNFAPMNQLLGLFKYGRGNVPPLQKLDEEETQIQRTVAIVPGGFKPPHKGHLAMVQHYAAISDVVYVFISPLSRGGPADQAEVSFSQSKQIWKLYLEAGGLSNVEVIERPSTNNSPVHSAYEFSENENDESFLAQVGDRILFGASQKEDLKSGAPDWHRFMNADRYVRDGAVAGDVEANASPSFFGGLSGTDFRKALHRGDIEDLKQRFIPNGDPTSAGQLPVVDPTEVLNILGVEAGSELGDFETVSEPATMGMMEALTQLIEETMDEMSSMSGGSVEGYSGGLKDDEEPSLIREEEPDEEDEVVEEVLNYLLGKGVLL
jgi:hypothetical protein